MDRSLNFCMITTFYPPYNFGGDGMFVYRLSNGLARRGHRVDVIHNVDAYNVLSPNELPPRPAPNHPNVRVHGLKSRFGSLSCLLTQQTGSAGFYKNRMEKILSDSAPDVIHFHNISLIGGPGVLGCGKAVKLYTTHEYWLVCPTHVLFKFDREACEKPSCFLCNLVYRKPPQLWRLTDRMERNLAHVDAFLSPSRFAVEMHRRMGLDIPTVQIPMFTPEPPERTRKNETELGAYMRRPYFLFVGRLEKLKGVQDLIPIFDEYQRADLVIAGEGNYGEELRSMAAGNPRIHFLGKLPYEELTALYSEAIALVVPSLCYETFGQVLVEAFSVKTPVITKDIGALSELVTESGGGFVYDENSSLIEIMEKFRADPGLRRELGERGYAAYLENWTEERYFEKYFKLISEIIDNKV